LISTHVLMPCVGLWVSFPGFVWERWLEEESALAILSNGYRARTAWSSWRGKRCTGNKCEKDVNWTTFLESF
jgi:hypothetical protein